MLSKFDFMRNWDPFPSLASRQGDRLGIDYASLQAMVTQPITWTVHAIIMLRSITFGRSDVWLLCWAMSPANSGIHACRKIYDAPITHMHTNMAIKNLYTLNRASIFSWQDLQNKTTLAYICTIFFKIIFFNTK
jgi:hypothetical protein